MKWTNVYGLDQLGSFLQKTRKEKGYTQDEFAEIIGASHATLSALENGKGVSSQTLMRAISDLGLKLVVLPKGAQAEVHDAPASVVSLLRSRQEGGQQGIPRPVRFASAARRLGNWLARRMALVSRSRKRWPRRIPFRLCSQRRSAFKRNPSMPSGRFPGSRGFCPKTRGSMSCSGFTVLARATILDCLSRLAGSAPAPLR